MTNKNRLRLDINASNLDTENLFTTTTVFSFKENFFLYFFKVEIECENK